MDIILIILERIFSVTFIQKAVTQGVPMLFGASGEIITERSGNLNLGIPGIMYMLSLIHILKNTIKHIRAIWQSSIAEM